MTPSVVTYEQLVATHGEPKPRRSLQYKDEPPNASNTAPPHAGFAYLVFECGAAARIVAGGDYRLVRECTNHA